MSTKDPDLFYKKDSWRKRNFSMVSRALYSTTSERYGWLEAFGSSGTLSRDQAIDAGLVRTAHDFYGVDNNETVVYDYYATHGFSDSTPKVWLGDAYVVAKRLSQKHTIGVYNFDMLGLAGHEKYWDLGQTTLIRDVLRTSLEKLPACVLILNHSAKTASGVHKIPDVVTHQHKKVAECLKGLGSQYVYELAPPEPSRIRTPTKADPDVTLSKNYELYLSEGRYLPMLTLRVCVRKRT